MATPPIRQFAVFAVCALVGSGTAEAQVTRDPDLAPTLDRDRSSPPQPGNPSPRLGFLLDLTMPFLYNSNPVLASSDIGPSGKGDWHADPDLLLGWTHQFASYRVSAFADIAVDRYLSRTIADEDTLSGGLKLALTDGSPGLLVPYASYTAIADFEPTFAGNDDVFHEFALGVFETVSVDVDGAVLRGSKAAAPGALSFGFDLKAGRRLADPKDFDASFALLKLDAAYVYSKDWAVEFIPRLKLRWYDEFDGAFRRDLRPSALLKAIWTPPWLTHLDRGAEIDLTVSYTRNYSTLEAARFANWEIGPTVDLSWKF